VNKGEGGIRTGVEMEENGIKKNWVSVKLKIKVPHDVVVWGSLGPLEAMTSPNEKKGGIENGRREKKHPIPFNPKQGIS